MEFEGSLLIGVGQEDGMGVGFNRHTMFALKKKTRHGLFAD